MGAQNGKDLLIKVDLTGDGQFETMAGLRATRVSFNAESVDVTTLESQGGWRELLSGAGVKSANISGSGVFKDAGDAMLEQVRLQALLQRPVSFRDLLRGDRPARAEVCSVLLCDLADLAGQQDQRLCWPLLDDCFERRREGRRAYARFLNEPVHEVG